MVDATAGRDIRHGRRIRHKNKTAVKECRIWCEAGVTNPQVYVGEERDIVKWFGMVIVGGALTGNSSVHAVYDWPAELNPIEMSDTEISHILTKIHLWPSEFDGNISRI